MRSDEHVARIGKIRYAYTIFVRKPSAKRQIGRSRNGWENSIEMYLEEIICEDVEWFHVAQNRVQSPVLVNMVMILLFPQKWVTF
jgi:hypothetical protein